MRIGSPPGSTLFRDIAWARTHMPLLEQALAGLPSLDHVRLACSIHLDPKMIPALEGLLDRGARLFLTTCNPSTAGDDVIAHLQARGAEVNAWRHMPKTAWQAAIEQALAWAPTHLCEMGADLSVALHRRDGPSAVQAGLEATGSGVARLAGLELRYPVFNWDDLPVKEGLHNRHMVGLTTWHAFFERTRLTLHGKRVLVIGYGLVGQGVADAARAYGGTVCVVERDPVRALQAAYAGWTVKPLDEALGDADVVVTATGAACVLGEAQLKRLKRGCFLLNVGHRDDESDLHALLSHPHREVLPFVEEVSLADRQLYLFAGGSMANLTAGSGDSLNAFDVTLAVMVAGIGHIAGAGMRAPPGLHLLPRAAWEAHITLHPG